MNLTLEYESFQDFANKLWPSLSEEGMWIRSDHPAAVGELVDFDVTLADGFRLFHGTGQVIAVGPGPGGPGAGEGMTLRFSQLDQPSRNLVRKVVSKHIGEGGELFVLSTPGTKVEVVGDEDPTAPGENAREGMGPSDLVAPFAGLEGSAAWQGEAEPELSSFLRPASRPADEEEPGEPALQFDFAAPTGGRPEEESASEVANEFELKADERGERGEAEEATADAASGETGSVPSEPAVEAEVVAESGPWNLEANDDDAEPSVADEPETEPTIPERERPFDPLSVETQQIDPLATGEVPAAAGFGLPSADEGGVEPRPSTVVPPAFPRYGSDDDSADAAEGAVDDELDLDEAAARPGRAWWPWVVVGGLAVGAGLYALLQMDTPLASLLGGGAETEQAVVEPEAPIVESEAPATADPSAAEPFVEVTATPDSMDLPAGVANGRGAASPGDSGDEGAESAVAAPARSAADSATAVESDPSPPAVEESRALEPTASAAPEVAQRAAPSPEVPALEPFQLQRITWREVDGDTVVSLALTGPLTAERFETQRVTTGSPRLVLKILGVRGGVPRAAVAIGSDEVEQLRFGVHDVAGVRQVHAVADLAAAGVVLIGAPTVGEGAVELRFGQPDE